MLRAIRLGLLPEVSITWAPLVEGGKASRTLLRRASAYVVLNSRDETKERWGVSDPLTVQVRQLLLADDTDAAEVGEQVAWAAPSWPPALVSRLRYRAPS